MSTRVHGGDRASHRRGPSDGSVTAVRTTVRSNLVGAGLATIAVLLVGCSAGGDPATWELRSDDLTVDSQVLEIAVSRVACSGGETGEVLEPQVTYDEDRIIVQVDVAPLGAGDYTCPGNDAVPVSVQLAEPLGDRELVDGACLDGDTTRTSMCETATRWPLTAGLEQQTS